MIISTMHDHDFDAEGCDYDEEKEEAAAEEEDL